MYQVVIGYYVLKPTNFFNKKVDGLNSPPTFIFSFFLSLLTYCNFYVTFNTSIKTTHVFSFSLDSVCSSNL